MKTPYFPAGLQALSIGPVRARRPGHRAWTEFAVRLRDLAAVAAARAATPQESVACDSHRSGDATAIANAMLAALMRAQRH